MSKLFNMTYDEDTNKIINYKANICPSDDAGVMIGVVRKVSWATSAVSSN